MKKILIIVFALLLFFKYSPAQNLFPKELVGYWINAEYENALTDSQGDKVSALISPQFLYFDLFGNCTIQTRIEHKLIIGKPIRKRKFGDTFQFTYTINKSNFTINEVEDNEELIYINFSNIAVSILFKKYKRN